jgi:hypothetical protein
VLLGIERGVGPISCRGWKCRRWGAFRDHVLDYRGPVVEISSSLSLSPTVVSGNIGTVKMDDILLKLRMAIETL